jgi:hypothetical protein
LVSKFGVTDREEQPTPEQIAAAVQAYAHLGAIEWGVQRKRLRTLCGDGLRLSDLDRQYQQARKALERERRQEYNESEEYYADEGRMVYRRDTHRGPVEKMVAAWEGRVVEHISQINDDGQVEHVTALELRNKYHRCYLGCWCWMFHPGSIAIPVGKCSPRRMGCDRICPASPSRWRHGLPDRSRKMI